MLKNLRKHIDSFYIFFGSQSYQSFDKLLSTVLQILAFSILPSLFYSYNPLHEKHVQGR